MKVKFTKLDNGVSYVEIKKSNTTTRNRIYPDTDLELNSEGLAITNPSVRDTPLGSRLKFQLADIDNTDTDSPIDTSSLEAAHESILGFFFNAPLTGTGGGAIGTPPGTKMEKAIALKSLLSDAGNVRALFDGDEIALWLNAILDEPGGLVTENGLLAKNYVNQSTLNSSMSFLLGQIAGGGATFNPNSVTGLFVNWDTPVGRTMVGTTGIDAHADSSPYENHRIAQSAILRPTLNAIDGSIAYNGSQGLYVQHLKMPATQTITIYTVCKNTGGSAIGMLMELTSDYNNSNTGFAFLQNTPNAGSLLASMIEGVDSGYGTTGPQNQYMVVRVVLSKIGGVGHVQVYVNGTLTGTVISSSGTRSGFIEGLPEYTDPITSVVTPATGHPLFVGSRNNSSVFATYEEKQTLMYAKDLSQLEDEYITGGLKLKHGIL